MKDQNIEKTSVARIVVESMSGKANELPPRTVLLGRFHVQE
jgi:hypothetical protein